ncbi:MAG: mercury methylation corrinoid protein HgcA [Desulfurivibrionaceae bacterium]|nr:mercury methylation corrinoid protein HgcA [Desulfurivibrionaceae bacterium]
MVKPLSPFPMLDSRPEEIPCCGPASSPPAGKDERPGYKICRYVRDFVQTGAGPVPRVSAELEFHDKLGAGMVRLGIGRDEYRIPPGLYCAGNPDRESPVLVSANYKLSFDYLRRELRGQDVWILVLDTRGINVWCAAAHKTFGTEELARVIEASGLSRVVSHRRLVVPQLGAAGVAAPALKKASGFEVVWGPLRARDLPGFLAASCKAEPAMRKLTFTMTERMTLAPVELAMVLKPALLIMVAMFFVSGFGPELFSFGRAWSRWLLFSRAFLAGLLSGAVLVPALLPWLPFRPFYLKGIVAALPVAGAVLLGSNAVSPVEMAAQAFICLAVSSYMAMNFTGATPYASPSGVEWEMRRAIPLQGVLVLTALGLWLVRPFL